MSQTATTLTDTGELAGKYLTFHLGDEVFGIEILKVREIIGLMDITRVPRTPENIRGVINLRGKIIAVVDLRAKFAMEPAPDTEQTCIIVVDVQTPDGIYHSGILVDGVSEVRGIEADQIEPAPSFGAGVDSGFIRAIAKCDRHVAILLNIERVLDTSRLPDSGQADQQEPAS